MKIENINIVNFQSYYGDHSFKFGEGLNLIIGNGGKGKSKLFNAFYWVLFGHIYITDYGWCPTESLPLKEKNIHMMKHEFINKKALHDAAPSNMVRCSVDMVLKDDDGNSYEIERMITAKRKQRGNWDSDFSWEISPSVLKVSYDTNTGTKVALDDMAEDKIANLFPIGIRGYIWFQGESLDKLIDFTKPSILREAVKHISYYPYYEKLTSIISKAKEKIARLENAHLRQANNENSAARALLKEIERLNEKIGTFEEDKKKLEDVISKIQVTLAEDEGKISGLAKFSEIVSEYGKCDQEIRNIMNEMTQLDDEERKLLPTLWVLRGTDELIARSKEIINAHVEEVYTAPEKKFLDNPSRAKLEEILNKDHKCFVCGCPVDDNHPDQVNWIRNRLRMQDEFLREMEEYKANAENSARFNMLVGRIQDFPDGLLVSIESIDKQYLTIEEQIEKLQARKRALTEKKTALDEKIEDIKRKHGVDPRKEADKFSTFDNTIKASRSNLEKKQKDLKTCEEAIRTYKQELKKKQEDLKQYGENTGAVTEVEETEWNQISSVLEAICSQVQENARVELLRKIEERANEFYRKFTEHDKGYKGDVKIDDNYSILFDTNLNTSHEDRKKMSIINALLSLNQEALGAYYPFISDAPTSNFDPATTHKYLMGVKDIFKQTIIMTKDVNVGSKEYEDLFNANRVSHIYQLSSDIYSENSREPEIFEVCTHVDRLK